MSVRAAISDPVARSLIYENAITVSVPGEGTGTEDFFVQAVSIKGEKERERRLNFIPGEESIGNGERVQISGRREGDTR